MREVHFTVPGKPFGKERPRARVSGSFATIYTPRKTKVYEALIAGHYLAAGGRRMGDGPIGVEIAAYFQIPPSWPKLRKQIARNGGMVCRTPDIDNIAKAILDGLEGVAYENDKQVDSLRALRRYSDEARGEVRVWEVAT